MKKTNNQILAEIAEEILKGDIVIYSGKSEKLLNSFSKYCASHPDLYFYECFTNWYKLNEKRIKKDAEKK